MLYHYINRTYNVSEELIDGLTRSAMQIMLLCANLYYPDRIPII